MTDTLNAPALPAVNFEPETIARHVCCAVAELGDRNSPEDQPSMMLVTDDELFGIVIEAFADNAEARNLEGGRESVEDALAIVESFGPGTAGVNDTFARQILLAAEVVRLRALAARSTTPSPAAPDGWKLVPIEPTDAMLDAAARASMQHLLDCINDPSRAAEVGSEKNVRLTHGSRYRSMLAAAPVEPSPGAPARAAFLNERDAADLKRIDNLFEDGEGWDLPTERMKRLAELGVVRRNGGAYYSITSFGRWILGESLSRLPLETSVEANARLDAEARARNSAAPVSPNTAGGV